MTWWKESPADDPRNPVVTQCDPKPGPERQWDWEARRRDFDEDPGFGLTGYGISPEAAIADLLLQEDEQDDEAISRDAAAASVTRMKNEQNPPQEPPMSAPETPRTDADDLIVEAMQAAIDYIMTIGPQVGKEQQEGLVQQLKKCVELRDEADAARRLARKGG